MYIYIYVYCRRLQIQISRIIPGSYIYIHNSIYIYPWRIQIRISPIIPGSYTYVYIYMYTSYTLHESPLWVYMCSSTSKHNVIFALFSCQSPAHLLYVWTSAAYCICRLQQSACQLLCPKKPSLSYHLQR